MQEGSVIPEHRKLGPNVGCYRWREAGPNGKRVHGRIVFGTTEQNKDAWRCSPLPGTQRMLVSTRLVSMDSRESEGGSSKEGGWLALSV